MTTMIHSRKKKILSFLLALLMLTSTAAPALADVFAFVTVEEEPAPIYTEGVLSASLNGYSVTVRYGADAEIPEGAAVLLYEIPEGTLQYDGYRAAAEDTLAEDEQTVFARFFDITLINEAGEKIEPAAPVDVEISAEEVGTAERVTVVHFPEAEKESAEEFDKEAALEEFALKGTMAADLPAEGVGRAELTVEDDTPVYDGEVPAEEAEDAGLSEMEIVNADVIEGGVISFVADGFSVYGVVGTETLTTRVITASGEAYDIFVTYDKKETGIPDTAVLYAEEIVDEEKVEAAKAALGGGVVRSSHLFDIKILNEGAEIQPNAPVEVRIEVAEEVKGTSKVGTVHFHGEDEPKVIDDAEVETIQEWLESVTFETDGFSIFAVIVIDQDEGEFVVEDENYKVTVAYTKEANIPLGTVMTVRETTPEEDRYWDLRRETIEKLNEGLEWEDTEMTPDPRKGITDAVFFDISLEYEGTEIEPEVPLQVKIEYKNGGISVPEDEETKIVHFAKEGIEKIDDVRVEYAETEEEGNIAVSYEYEQGSFSEVGSYSTGEYIEINESNIVYPSAGIMAAPVLLAAGDSSITAEKTITDIDNDGVYELALSVTGSSESSSSTTVNKSNVVLVIDTSGSMGGQNYVYTPYTYNASTYDSSTTYYGVYNGNYYEVTRNYNNTGWRYSNYNSSYTGTVYIRQTRLDATKAAATALVDALLANNKNEDKDGVSLRDIVEISLISFSGNSQVNGSTSINDAVIRVSSTSGNTTNATVIKNAINNLSAGGGTNWEAALRRAKTEADSYASQTGESTSIIFLTDGMPTFYLNNADSRRAGYGGTGTEERDNVHNSWTYAADDARALVSAEYTLYNIFAFGTDTVQFNNDNNNTDADYLRSLTNYAYKGTGNYNNKTLDSTTSKYFFNASNTTALQEAFNAIINSINNTVGYGGVTVDDGVTLGVTNTSVSVDGTVNTSNFRYSIKNGDTTLVDIKISGNTATFTSPTTGSTATATGVETTVPINGTNHTNTLFTATVDGVEYKICPATMDSNGKVVWELAPVGIIENGRTYELEFDVWPNQLAYDLVADLNNGVKTLEQVRAEIIASKGQAVWDQIYNALVKPGDTYVNEDGETVTATAYEARTNYEQYVDYYTVDTKQEEGQDPVTTYTPQPRKELGPKDPVHLTSSKMDLKKIWDDSLDRSQLEELLWEDYPTNTQPIIIRDENDVPTGEVGYKVKLHIWKADTLTDLETKINNYAEAVEGSYALADANDYMDKTLGWNGTEYDWDDTLEVAPGTMIELSKAREMGIDVDNNKIVNYTKTVKDDLGNETVVTTQYYILEAGHYYTVTEENIDRHFELNTIIYHPMLIDGVLSNVTFKADGTVEKIEPMSTVDATNTLKGGINILKRAFDGDTEILATDDIFTVQVTVNNADGTPYRDWDYRIYYGDNNPLKTDTVYRSGHYFGTQAAMDASGSSGQVDPVNGGSNVITLDLYIGDTVRIINVPAGVTYTVVETKVNEEPLTNGAASNYVFNEIVYELSEGSGDNFVVETGESHSVHGNSSSQATVYNKIPAQKIGVKKIGEGNTNNTLAGVTFKIYKDEELTNQVIKDALGNPVGINGELTTDENGIVNIGTLLAGKYYLVETSLGNNGGYNMLTSPIVISVSNKENATEKVTYTQYDYSAANDTNHDPENGRGVLIEERTEIITNNDGTTTELKYNYYTITVNNTSGVELPSTGFDHPIAYTVAGLAMVGAVGAVLYHRKKQDE